jgi:hypothetical protein
MEIRRRGLANVTCELMNWVYLHAISWKSFNKNKIINVLIIMSLREPIKSKSVCYMKPETQIPDKTFYLGNGTQGNINRVYYNVLYMGSDCNTFLAVVSHFRSSPLRRNREFS